MMLNSEKLMIDRARKMTPEEMESCVGIYSMPLYSEVRDVSTKDRTLVFRINSASMDSYNSIVSPRGADMKSYHDRFNVVMRGHNTEIGKALWKKMNADRTAWDSMAELSRSQLADETLTLVADGVLKGASVGILKIRRQYFGDQAGVEFEKDYSDVELKASPGMDWYIAEWVLGEWSITGTPANYDAEIQRKIAGMSEATQMWVLNSYMSEQFPIIKKELEEIKANKFITERELDDKLQKMLDMGAGAKPVDVTEGAGAKPVVRSVDRKTYEKLLDYMREQKMNEKKELERMALKKINYLRGIVE